MNFNIIKNKLLLFKSILVVHWTIFTVKHPRYNKLYFHVEIKKMMNCVSEASDSAAFQCLSCGEGKHIVNFSCKGKACSQCGNPYLREYGKDSKYAITWSEIQTGGVNITE